MSWSQTTISNSYNVKSRDEEVEGGVHVVAAGFDAEDYNRY